LFQDAVQRARSKIVAQLSRERDQTALPWMLELSMAAPLPDDHPAIVVQHSQYVSHCHARRPIDAVQIVT
jgi:hypothetical protein